MAKKYTEDMLWPEWTDVLGNTYRPGDIIAIATVNGKSPQMVLAKVERINRVRSTGEEIMVNQTVLLDEPIRHERECFTVKRLQENRGYYYDRNHVCTADCTEYWERTKTVKVPSCTVTATPVMDCRGFGRWSTDHDGNNKPVNYSIPNNIIFVEEGQ